MVINYGECLRCAGEGCSSCNNYGKRFYNFDWRIEELKREVDIIKSNCECCNEVIEEMEKRGFIISYPNSFIKTMLKERRWH